MRSHVDLGLAVAVVLIGVGGCFSSHSSGHTGPPVEREVRKPATIEAMLTDTLIRNLDARKVRLATKEWASVREMLGLLKSDIAFKSMGVPLKIDFDPALERERADALRTKYRVFYLAGEFRLEAALRQILDQAGLGYAVRGGRIVVTARPPEKFRPLVDMTEESQALKASLKRLEVGYTMHVDEMFDGFAREMARYYAIPIVVRPEVYDVLKTEQQRMITLRIERGTSVAEVFATVLAKVNLVYVIRDGAVIIVPLSNGQGVSIP